MSADRAAFHRNITVELEGNQTVGTPGGKVVFLDNVHDMSLVARMGGPCVEELTMSPGRHPFPVCEGVIQNSAAVWRGADLTDDADMQRRWREARGCEHIAESMRFLAFAFRGQISNLWLSLTSALHQEAGVIRTELAGHADELAMKNLVLETPIIMNGDTLQSRGSQVVLAPAIPGLPGAERALPCKPGEWAAALREKDTPSARLAGQLLRLFRETHRAVTSNLTHGGSRPYGGVVYDAFVDGVRRGAYPTVRCGALEGRGIIGPAEKAKRLQEIPGPGDSTPQVPQPVQ